MLPSQLAPTSLYDEDNMMDLCKGAMLIKIR